MHAFIAGFYRLSWIALVTSGTWGSGAWADKIGGSNLPSTQPVLKGRITSETDAASAFLIGSNIGATTNAGPTLSETSSIFIDRIFGFAAVRTTELGRLDVSVTLSDRLYAAFDEANETSGGLAMNLTKDWGGQQTLLSFAMSKTRDVEERILETGLALSHAWTSGQAKPYFKGEVALLNYDDVPGAFLPFSNQDDRDRISSRAQIGLRLTLTDHIEMEVGAGVDSKRYLDTYDDFGVRRGNVSLFPVIGLTYTGTAFTLSGLYMPLWRTYEEDLFRSRWKHAFALEGGAQLSSDLKAFGAVRYGFYETDFLVASSAYEAVAVGGLTLSVGKGTLSFAVSETWRTYDDLDLMFIERADRKFEMALSGELPITESTTMNARVSYLDYRSSFDDVSTDAISASLGLTYAAVQ